MENKGASRRSVVDMTNCRHWDGNSWLVVDAVKLWGTFNSKKRQSLLNAWI